MKQEDIFYKTLARIFVTYQFQKSNIVFYNIRTDKIERNTIIETMYFYVAKRKEYLRVKKNGDLHV